MRDWQKLPDSEGDWLWVEMWSCGCCVLGSGIAWVSKEINGDGDWQVGKFKISWEGKQPTLEKGEPAMITGWKKVDLPPKKWAEDWS
tara:strand:+ start:3116 stop:3376 length:261 start_codon:yes stop_codon:yes gene_type:complete